MPRPTTPITIRTFLGLAGFYKRFVDGFAFIACLLTTLTQNSNKFEWSETCERSFKILKYRITCTTVLTLLEGTKGTIAYCDASLVGLGLYLCNMGR